VIATDDFGLRPMRSPQDEDFNELISECYEKKTTLVTSNLAFDEWGAAFPNKLMGAATIDRRLLVLTTCLSPEVRVTCAIGAPVFHWSLTDLGHTGS
jgi:DNA replication protein DnaC